MNFKKTIRTLMRLVFTIALIIAAIFAFKAMIHFTKLAIDNAVLRYEQGLTTEDPIYALIVSPMVCSPFGITGFGLIVVAALRIMEPLSLTLNASHAERDYYVARGKDAPYEEVKKLRRAFTKASAKKKIYFSNYYF